MARQYSDQSKTIQYQTHSENCYVLYRYTWVHVLSSHFLILSLSVFHCLTICTLFVKLSTESNYNPVTCHHYILPFLSCSFSPPLPLLSSPPPLFLLFLYMHTQVEYTLQERLKPDNVKVIDSVHIWPTTVITEPLLFVSLW